MTMTKRQREEFSASILLTPEHPELEAVKRCVRISLERALIECGRLIGRSDAQHKTTLGRYRAAKQVGRDICALHGLDFDALFDIDDEGQRQIRQLFWPDQQIASAAAIRRLTSSEEEGVSTNDIE